MRVYQFRHSDTGVQSIGNRAGNFNAARILVGTCSWTDPSLISSGAFYPAEVKSAEARLRYYAANFPIVEVDSTYYAPLNRRHCELWTARTPAHFTFNIKAFALLTGHSATIERLPPDLRAEVLPGAREKKRLVLSDLSTAAQDALWELHRSALVPLLAAGKLGALLFQFAPRFTCTAAHRAYLAQLAERLAGLPLAIEFRGGGWIESSAAATLALLRELDLTYVCVDEPQGAGPATPPLVAATNSLAMIRLHGRNAATWQTTHGPASERFKYLYSDDELQEWIPKIASLTERAPTLHVLFNNNYADWGPRNARRMSHLLGLATAPLEPLQLDFTEPASD